MSNSYSFVRNSSASFGKSANYNWPERKKLEQLVLEIPEKFRAFFTEVPEEIQQKNADFRENLKKLKLNIEKQIFQSIELINDEALRKCFIDQFQWIQIGAEYRNLVKRNLELHAGMK